MFLIINADSTKRLCCDNFWRGFANFGDYPECVKEYRRKSAAITKAKKVKGKVIEIPRDVTIEAGGYCYRTVLKGPNEAAEPVSIDSLIVWTPPLGSTSNP